MIEDDEPNKLRSALRWAVLRILMVGCCFAIWFAVLNPKSPLSMAWNPFTPLHVQSAVTPMTGWKLRRALGDADSCMAALETSATVSRVPDLEESAVCHIRPQVTVRQVGAANLKPLNTRCQTALRMAMWEEHGIQPAAKRYFDQPVREILHLSSYNCRQIRTLQGDNSRMSTHATADAVDVSGFVLEDGKKITLLENWEAPKAEASFLLEVADSACEWFRVTLSPEYNALHADHFHLQHTGWGLCR